MRSGFDTSFVIREIRTSRSNGSPMRKTFSVSINGRNGVVVREQSDDNDVVIERTRNRTQRGNHYTRNSVTAALGFTNYLSPSGKFPDSENKPYGLNQLGSRYFSLGWKWGHRYYNSRLGFNLGFEFAWQNFMLQDAYRFEKGTDSLVLKNYVGKRDTSVLKSKLVVAALKIPVGIAYRINNSWFVEAGGFVGMRLDSHTKFKYDQQGSTRKDTDNSNFYLNNFMYGVNAQVRNRNWGIFGEYNLNPLFTSKGPDLRAFQFGVSC
jgi:hypothetical protein